MGGMEIAIKMMIVRLDDDDDENVVKNKFQI